MLRAARGSARRSVGAVSRAGGRGGRQGGRGRGRGGGGGGTQPSVQLGTAIAAVASEINPGFVAGGAGGTVVSPGAGRKRREAEHRSPEGPPVPLQPRPGVGGNANQPLGNGGSILSRAVKSRSRFLRRCRSRRARAAPSAMASRSARPSWTTTKTPPRALGIRNSGLTPTPSLWGVATHFGRF